MSACVFCLFAFFFFLPPSCYRRPPGCSGWCWTGPRWEKCCCLWSHGTGRRHGGRSGLDPPQCSRRRAQDSSWSSRWWSEPHSTQRCLSPLEGKHGRFSQMLLISTFLWFQVVSNFQFDLNAAEVKQRNHFDSKENEENKVPDYTFGIKLEFWWQFCELQHFIYTMKENVWFFSTGVNVHCNF